MRFFSLIVLTMGIVCSQAAAGPLISYDAYAQMRVEIIGIRDAGGVLLPGRPDDLFIEGGAYVDYDWTNATGTAVATTGGLGSVEAEDAFDLQVGDAVFVRSAVSGQAQPPADVSEASSFVWGDLYFMNMGPSDYLVDFRMDWEYSAVGPSLAELLAGDFDGDILWQASNEGLSAGAGSLEYQFLVPSWGYNQLLVGTAADGWTPAVPVPPSVALVLGMLGILRTARRRLHS